MNTIEFIQKWQNSRNHLGLPSVGINVRWDLISNDSLVKQLSGEKAWSNIRKFTVPWFKSPKNFEQLLNTRDTDFQQILKEETENGKIDYYKKNGIQEPFFCAFAREDDFAILGDGNHRYFDCLYLIEEEKIQLDVNKTTLDILILENFDEVLEPVKIWPLTYIPLNSS